MCLADAGPCLGNHNAPDSLGLGVGWPTFAVRRGLETSDGCRLLLRHTNSGILVNGGSTTNSTRLGQAWNSSTVPVVNFTDITDRRYTVHMSVPQITKIVDTIPISLEFICKQGPALVAGSGAYFTLARILASLATWPVATPRWKAGYQLRLTGVLVPLSRMQ